MARRTKARDLALQLLYQVDLNEDTTGKDASEQIQERLGDPEMADFAWKLFSGVRDHKDELDEKISSFAKNWSLSRMAATDRNVLRLGAYELIYMETPYSITIDEAIELAKRFGATQSAPFVNGILDKLVPSEKREAETNATKKPAD